MFKHLIIILLLLSCIAPAFAASNATISPTCPPQKIVYVTVTVPVPVPVYQQTGSTPTAKPTPVTTTEPTLTEYITTNPELLVYGVLFLVLIVGIILMWRKNKKGKPPVSKPDTIDELNLFEDDPPKKWVEIPTKPEVQNKLFNKKIVPKVIQTVKPKVEEKQEPKKPKKPKSLLEQDFEF